MIPPENRSFGNRLLRAPPLPGECSGADHPPPRDRRSRFLCRGGPRGKL